MEIGLSEVIKFCIRKLITRTHFMSPLKIINLFQDMIPNFSPQNAGLEVLRPAIFMIIGHIWSPQIKYCMSEKQCEPFHFCWRVESSTKLKKKWGKGGLTCTQFLDGGCWKDRSEIFQDGGGACSFYITIN